MSGQTYAAFLEQVIITPLNMRNSGYEDNSSGVAFRYLASMLVSSDRVSAMLTDKVECAQQLGFTSDLPRSDSLLGILIL